MRKMVVQTSEGAAEMVRRLRRGISYPRDFSLLLLLNTEGMLLDLMQDISRFRVYSSLDIATIQ